MKNIPHPNCIAKYNKFMSGVALLDAMTAVYGIRYRNKKWWWAFYAWFLNAAAVNAWRLRQKLTGKKEPYLPFLQELVIEIMKTDGCLPISCL